MTKRQLLFAALLPINLAGLIYGLTTGSISSLIFCGMGTVACVLGLVQR